MLLRIAPQRLFKKGVPLARYLVQELFINKAQYRNLPDPALEIESPTVYDPKFFGPTVPAADWKPSEKWGSTLPASSLAVVLQEATRKWGDELELCETEGDNSLHAPWWSIGRSGVVRDLDSLGMPGFRPDSADDKALTEMVKELYRKFDFMPFFSTLLAVRVCESPLSTRYSALGDYALLT